MSKNKTQLAANARVQAGKGAARAVRRTGNIPGVIYGDRKEPVLITLTEKDLVKGLKSKGFFTQLCDLTVAGQKHLVLPREVQLNPVSDRPEHADFLRVSDKTTIRVQIPVRVTNEKGSPGIVKGGVLNLVNHEIEVFCKATDIPDEFVLDLTGLDLGGSIHIEDVKMPSGVKPTQQGNFTVATLVAPTALKAEDDKPAEATAAADGAAAAASAPAAAGAAAPAAAAAAAPAKDAKAKK